MPDIPSRSIFSVDLRSIMALYGGAGGGGGSGRSGVELRHLQTCGKQRVTQYESSIECKCVQGKGSELSIHTPSIYHTTINTLPFKGLQKKAMHILAEHMEEQVKRTTTAIPSHKSKRCGMQRSLVSEANVMSLRL